MSLRGQIIGIPLISFLGAAAFFNGAIFLLTGSDVSAFDFLAFGRSSASADAFLFMVFVAAGSAAFGLGARVDLVEVEAGAALDAAFFGGIVAVVLADVNVFECIKRGVKRSAQIKTKGSYRISN